MIYLYLFSLVVGGVLLGTSLILGGHGEDAAGHDTDGMIGAEPFIAAFMSVRFWTFFLAFFGLTGLVFEGFGLVPWSLLSAIIAVAVGLAAGMIATWAVRELTKSGSNSAVSAADYLGKTGRVLVGFSGEAAGKVRLELKGSTVDVLATAIDAKTFVPKDEVVVVELDGLKVRVAHTRTSVT